MSAAWIVLTLAAFAVGCMAGIFVACVQFKRGAWNYDNYE